ncbi:MAG: hypothetical protein NZ556_07800 [Fimbriimonadales bacterium]|nr:hypothetical protein [Fimbriimonadales bacterium]
MTPMTLFHSITAGFETRLFPALPEGFLNLLVSAWVLHQYPHRVHHPHLRRVAKALFVDSGAIGALKRGRAEWLQEGEAYLLHCAEQLRASFVACMDIPCVPELLARVGLTVCEAQRHTVQSAFRLLERIPERVPNATLVVALQGWTRSDYEACASLYEREGLFTGDPAKVRFAVGSIAYRDGVERVRIARFVRQLVPPQFALHAFGVGSLRDMRALVGVVDSCDSSSASTHAAYGKVVARAGTLPLGRTPRCDWQTAALWLYNALTLERCLHATPSKASAQLELGFEGTDGASSTLLRRDAPRPARRRGRTYDDALPARPD